MTKTEAATSLSKTEAANAPPVWATLVATFFGIGRLRPGPGTWGSLASALIWFAAGRAIPPPFRTPVLGALIGITIAVGIPAATRVARASGLKDPQFVVIDEVLGQWLTFLFVPLTWKTLLAGFILFRGFDIVKPPPIRQLEKLPGGTGIVLDDVAAGVFALAVMQLLGHSGLLFR